MIRTVSSVAFWLVSFTALSQDTTLQVKIFLGVDCPISQKYITRLNEIQQRFAAKGVTMTGIVPGKASNEQLKGFVDEYSIAFPLVNDPKWEEVKKYHITITPEAVLVKSNDEKVYYQGAIDNWFFELGRYRIVTTEYYLTEAIDAVLNGKKPKIDKTEAIGCFVQVPAGSKHVH